MVQPPVPKIAFNDPELYRRAEAVIAAKDDDERRDLAWELLKRLPVDFLSDQLGVSFAKVIVGVQRASERQPA